MFGPAEYPHFLKSVIRSDIYPDTRYPTIDQIFASGLCRISDLIAHWPKYLVARYEAAGYQADSVSGPSRILKVDAVGARLYRGQLFCKTGLFSS